MHTRQALFQQPHPLDTFLTCFNLSCIFLSNFGNQSLSNAHSSRQSTSELLPSDNMVLKPYLIVLIVLMKILVSAVFFLHPTLISDDTIFQNPMVQEAIRMGFSFRDIKKTMEEKIQTSGSSYLSLEVLIADLVSAQKDNTQDESSQTSLQKGMDWGVFVCLFD